MRNNGASTSENAHDNMGVHSSILIMDGEQPQNLWERHPAATCRNWKAVPTVC